MKNEVNKNIIIDNIKSSIEIQYFNACFKKKKPVSTYHFHNCFQIIILLKGNVEVIVDSIIKRLEAGSVIILGSDLPHGIIKYSEDTEAILIHLPISTMLWLKDRTDLINEMNFINNSEYGYLIKSEGLINNLKKLINKIQKNSGFEKVSLIFKLLSLLNKEPEKEFLITNQSKSLSSSEINYDSSIEKTIKYIYKNFRKEIKLGELAKIASLNTSSLCRTFKRVNGITIFSFINKLRIEKACVLLKSTDLNISEIAFEVGYNTISNFNAQFQHFTQMSAKQYRDKN